MNISLKLGNIFAVSSLHLLVKLFKNKNYKKGSKYSRQVLKVHSAFFDIVICFIVTSSCTKSSG